MGAGLHCILVVFCGPPTNFELLHSMKGSRTGAKHSSRDKPCYSLIMKAHFVVV